MLDKVSGVPVFQLLQWKYAIELEAKGMRHSSGRSVYAHAKRVLGIKGNRDKVIAHINKLLSDYRDSQKEVNNA